LDARGLDVLLAERRDRDGDVLKRLGAAAGGDDDLLEGTGLSERRAAHRGEYRRSQKADCQAVETLLVHDRASPHNAPCSKQTMVAPRLRLFHERVNSRAEDDDAAEPADDTNLRTLLAYALADRIRDFRACSMNDGRSTAHTPRLLITGASGQLGRRTAEFVLEAVEPGRLILVTRNPDALADLAALGVDVRQGDFNDPASLRRAFEGAGRLLLISATDLERRVEQHRNAIRAAVDSGVSHVIYTSGLRSEPGNPAAVSPSHYATEQALAESGLSWTVLRNSLYAEYQAIEAQRAIESGKPVHNRGDGEVA